MQYKKLWIALAVVMIVSFAVLGGVGYKTIKEAPPIPAQVVTADGHVLFDGETIKTGQNVWQSIGGQEVGTVWGHGAYVAPDWTADWLHRESEYILNRWAREAGAADFASLTAEQQGGLRERLAQLMRSNTYDAATDHIVLDPVRADAFEAVAAHYADVFSNGRDAYAIQKGAESDPIRLRQMASFFWWTSWAASTNRPGHTVTYTQNWPHEELVNNRPTGSTIVWSVVSFVLLLAGVGGMVWYFGSKQGQHEPVSELPNAIRCSG
jgi:nitric oxide reductase subunit B